MVPWSTGPKRAKTFADRPALDSGALVLSDFLAKHDLRLALDHITPWSHWITPTFVKRRYDTSFYLAAVPEGQVEDAESKETVEMIWIRPEAALDASEAGERSLYFATRLNVLELARLDSVTSTLAHARAKTITVTRPEHVEADDGGYMLHLGAESDYGVWNIPLPVAIGQKPLKSVASGTGR